MLNDPGKIRERWHNAEAFYRERDARTQLEVTELHRYVEHPIEIHIDEELGTQITIQRIALLATNLTARWARKVLVVVPKVPLAPPLQAFGDERLDQRIMREMSGADPFGNFSVKERGSRDPDVLRLFIGPCRRSAKTQTDYSVTAKGWSVLGNRGTAISFDSTVPAAAPTAALAGALGAGDLFKRAIGHCRAEWLGNVRWSTWNHVLGGSDSCRPTPRVPETAELGNLLVAGIGAIGSALLYILGLMPLHGRVTVLDRDLIETSNLNRSPLFNAVDVVDGGRKVDVAYRFLRRLGVETDAVMGTWRERSGQFSRESFDVWVSLTNEDGAWAEVPFQLPPVVLHGTTTSGWGVGFGRHIPRIEDCTACRLPRPHAEFRGPCSEGEVSSDIQEPIRASLPFLSTISAALIATELLKLGFSEVSSLPNAVYADLRLGLPAVISALIGPTARCRGCEMARMPLWLERGGRGRYAGFSIAI